MAGLPSIQSTDHLMTWVQAQGYSSHVVSPFTPHVMSQFVFFCYTSDSGLFSLQTIKDNCTYIKLSLTQDLRYSRKKQTGTLHEA